MKIVKVINLPQTYEADTIYIVRSSTSGLVEIYVTDNTGSEIRTLPDDSGVISSLLPRSEVGMTVASLVDGKIPTDQLPPAILGVLTYSGMPASSFVLSNEDGNLDGSAAQKVIPAGVVVGTTDAQTLSNKTLATPVLTGTREVLVAMPASAIDLSAGNVFTKTISGETTLTVSNTPTTGIAASFILELTNAGSAAITWFSGVKWAGGTAPTLTEAGVDVLGFYSHDGGTTWRGMVLAKDSK